LLKIREGFVAVDGTEFEDDQPPKGEVERNLIGSTIHSAEYKILGGDIVSLEDLVNMAFDDSGLDESTWNEQSDEDHYAFIDATLLELQGGSKSDEEDNQPADNPGNADESAIPADSNVSAQDTAAGLDDVPAQESTGAEQSDNQPADAKSTMTRAELEPLYVQRFGRKPSSKMKNADIVRALNEDDD